MRVLRRPMLVLLAGLAACTPAPPSQPDAVPLRPAIRLADHGRSGAELGAVPSIAAGGVRRPVLARSAAVPLGTAKAAPGVVTVPVRRPGDLGDAPLRLAVSGAAAGGAAPPVDPPVLASGTTGGEVRVRVPGPGSGTELTVTGRPAPPAIQTTQALAIPAAAVLRFAIGVDEQEWPDGLAPIVFRVAVVGDGDGEVIFERTLDPADARQRGWLDAEVDLARFAGRTLSFRFETVTQPGRGGLFTFPAWADPTLLVRTTDAPRRPNILLISLDTLRADHMGAYGYARPTTPAIDARLAARGTVFERAYTSYPSTPGAHMTLFTALLTCVHGVDGASLDNRLALDLTTLPELLRAAGYATAAFVENAWVTHSLGFARGFGTWVENTSPQVTAPIGQADKTFAAAAAWIGANRERPWLVFAHTYQVHHPHTPPEGYVEQATGTPGEVGDATELEKARYDGEIRYTDDLLARLLDAIEAAGELRDTIVVLFSDHGEHFGEHGQHRHGFSLYDELLRVPLIVAGPGVPEGLRVPADVGLIDLLPTVLELAGLPAPAGRQGLSLTPLLRAGTLPPRTLFAELPLLGLVAARRDGRKLIADTKQGKAWTTDLSTDPREQSAAPSHDAPETLAWLAEFERTCAAGNARPAAQPGAGAPAEAVDPEVQDKLRALGYAE